ncbi:MAG: hypothetical protein WBF04_06985 [Candidatus Sulfotelmatobacter sp.]
MNNEQEKREFLSRLMREIERVGQQQGKMSTLFQDLTGKVIEGCRAQIMKRAKHIRGVAVKIIEDQQVQNCFGIQAEAEICLFGDDLKQTHVQKVTSKGSWEIVNGTKNEGDLKTIGEQELDYLCEQLRAMGFPIEEIRAARQSATHEEEGHAGAA